MKSKINITEIYRIGVDLTKNVIQVYSVDKDDKVLVKRRLSRAKALSFFESVEPCEIGIEACGGPMMALMSSTFSGSTSTFGPSGLLNQDEGVPERRAFGCPVLSQPITVQTHHHRDVHPPPREGPGRCPSETSHRCTGAHRNNRDF